MHVFEEDAKVCHTVTATKNKEPGRMISEPVFFCLFVCLIIPLYLLEVTSWPHTELTAGFHIMRSTVH